MQAQAGAAHPPVEVIQATAPDSSLLKSRKSSYSFTIESGDWTDTGVMVTPADQLNFTTTGNLTLADGRQAPPDGLTRGWKDLIRVYPLNSADAGALIGRVGNGDAAVPFLIGASKDLDVSATGHLYLRLNLSSDLSASGSLTVKMKLIEPAGGAEDRLRARSGSPSVAATVCLRSPPGRGSARQSRRHGELFPDR